MIGRRGVFRALMGVPLAAKGAADQVVAGLTGIGGTASQGLGSRWSGGDVPTISAVRGRTALDIAKAALQLPIPDWRVEQIKKECSYVSVLDPDIAALRSFSMSAKILMQRERNIEWRLDHSKNSHAFYLRRTEFEDRHGFWFW
jgi:hypothetical protein